MVLITGATGLVGTHLLIRLSDQEVKNSLQLRALYRSDTKRSLTKQLFFNYFIEIKKYPITKIEAIFDQIDWVQANLEDIEGLKNAFDKVSQVYHCAALISFAIADYKKLRKTNIEGTANIVNLCIEHHIKKLCYVSSIATLGNPIEDKPLDETAEWNPEALNSVYAITKYGAELEVWRGSQEGLEVVIVNPGVIIGSGSYTSGSGKIFNKVHQGLSYYTDGSTGFVGVQDVVTGMILLMDSKIKNERYVMVAENLTYKEILTKISEVLGKKPPAKEASPLMIEIYRLVLWLGTSLVGSKSEFSKAVSESLLTHVSYDASKIAKDLDFKFEPINEMIARTANHFFKNQH